MISVCACAPPPPPPSLFSPTRATAPTFLEAESAMAEMYAGKCTDNEAQAFDASFWLELEGRIAGDRTVDADEARDEFWRCEYRRKHATHGPHRSPPLLNSQSGTSSPFTAPSLSRSPAATGRRG